MNDHNGYRLDTLAIHAGQPAEPVTGAVMTPIFQTSTYAQPEPGEWAWEYSRTHNPTRTALQQCLAALEGGKHGLCFSSGLAAIDTVLRTFRPGDHVLCGDDVYGGTYRLFTKVCANFGLTFSFVDLSDPDLVVPKGTALVWAESPTNPTLKIVDLAALAGLARTHGVWFGVDNTFATPALQRPLELGADVVVHSTTKYLNGHSDVIGGAVMVQDDELAAKLRFLRNATGGVPSPFDCFLVLRGLKTLELRMQRHGASALELARALEGHAAIARVHHPGLASHDGHALAARQMSGPTGMIAIELRGGEDAARTLASGLRYFALAESLGGVESLIEHPASMTHASMPKELREEIGVTGSLLRLSVGLEDPRDLLGDLERGLAALPAAG